MFAVINSDDAIYYGELPTRKAEISFQQVMATLKPIPDSEIFPKLPLSGAKQFTQAPLELPANVQVFIKRPNISQYDVYKRYDVLVDDSEASGGMPVLIDLGSAGKIGSLLGTSRGTSGWIEGRIEDYTTSKKEHDIFALEKMRLWLDNPTFDDDEVGK